MSNKTEILTPVGRLVQGDCFEPQTTDAEGNPLVIKNGPNAGKPRVDYFMAIAIPKTDVTFNDLYATIVNVARQAFPSMFDAQGNCINPKFAFKITDGDSQVPNSKGSKPCDKEGFPGNWILSFSGGFAPKCYTAGGESILVAPTSPDGSVIKDQKPIKKGYFIRIAGSVTGNGSQQQPGIYLNHSMVELVAYGEEIISGPDGSAVFGGTPAGALPAGASATPPAPATAPLAQTPAPGSAPAAAPTPTSAPAAWGTPAPATANAPAAAPAPNAAPANVAPAPDFLNPQAPAEAKYYDPNGAGPFTEAQLVQAGYTPEQLAWLQRA